MQIPQRQAVFIRKMLFHRVLSCTRFFLHRTLLYTSFRPIRTPMEDAIIRPLVQPEESPRQ